MTEKRKLHICVATGQNLANLIPAVQCEATEAWILRTQAMRTSAEHLREALRRRDIKTVVLDFPNTDVAALNAAASDIAEKVPGEGHDVVINISGGTKLMALTLVQTLGSLLETGPTRPSIVYTDTERGVLEWLRPAIRVEQMQSVLDVDDVLRVNGYHRVVDSDHTRETREKWLEVARERQQLTFELAAKIPERYLDHAGYISALAREALDTLPQGSGLGSIELDRVPTGDRSRYIKLLEREGLLAHERGTSITFMSRDAARYCSGGWLEEFAALKAADACQRYGNFEAALQVETSENLTRNEIDLIFVRDNRTLVVECKAARTREDDVINWIAKLSDLAQRVAGSQATAFLLCARKLNEVQLKRAEDSNVRVCCGTDIVHFSRALHRWMGRSP
jgi:hypothetical protein